MPPENPIRFAPAEGKAPGTAGPRSRPPNEEETEMSTRTLPLRGAANPSSQRDGTNPGSFANAPNLGGALAFSSPDTPGMPQPSGKTAWDFLPAGWRRDGDRAIAPAGFVP